MDHPESEQAPGLHEIDLTLTRFPGPPQRLYCETCHGLAFTWEVWTVKVGIDRYTSLFLLAAAGYSAYCLPFRACPHEQELVCVMAQLVLLCLEAAPSVKLRVRDSFRNKNPWNPCKWLPAKTA
ncbi:hypothetical protein V2G26_003021 [Clonostachys chloroleuca]